MSPTAEVFSEDKPTIVTLFIALGAGQHPRHGTPTAGRLLSATVRPRLEGGNECARRYRCFPSLHQEPRVCLFLRHSETRTLVGGEKEGEKKGRRSAAVELLKGPVHLERFPEQLEEPAVFISGLI